MRVDDATEERAVGSWTGAEAVGSWTGDHGELVAGEQGGSW